MSDKYTIRNEVGLHFVTFTVVDWIDIFTRKEFKLLIIDSLKYCQLNKGLEIFAYCLMSNHLHLIIRAKEGFTLSPIIRDFKKYTSIEIIRMLDEINESRKEWMLNRFSFRAAGDSKIKHYQVWQKGYHAIELMSNKFMQQKLDYIHENPVRALIVSEPDHYWFSSARNYAGLEAFLDVEFLD